jgi:hypothetical protein
MGKIALIAIAIGVASLIGLAVFVFNYSSGTVVGSFVSPSVSSSISACRQKSSDFPSGQPAFSQSWWA